MSTNHQQGELAGFEVKEYLLQSTGLPVTTGTGGQTNGDVIGRISPRTSGSFEIRALSGGKPFSRPMRFLTPVHRNDGYGYA